MKSNSHDHKDEGAGARDASPLKQELQVFDSADARNGVKRHARLAASLAAAGFDLHYTSWGILIVALAAQSRAMPAVCCVAGFLHGVVR
jgi:hypothetical protein